jgi:site-specific recombinase XerD
MLGHASITTTQRYARLGADMVQREALRVYGGEELQQRL